MCSSTSYQYKVHVVHTSSRGMRNCSVTSEAGPPFAAAQILMLIEAARGGNKSAFACQPKTFSRSIGCLRKMACGVAKINCAFAFRTALYVCTQSRAPATHFEKAGEMFAIPGTWRNCSALPVFALSSLSLSSLSLSLLSLSPRPINKTFFRAICSQPYAFFIVIQTTITNLGQRGYERGAIHNLLRTSNNTFHMSLGKNRARD